MLEYVLAKITEIKPVDFRGLLLVVLVTGWLFGILLSAGLSSPPIVPAVLAVLSLALTGIFWRWPVVRYAALVLLCVCLAASRYALLSPLADPLLICTYIVH